MAYQCPLLPKYGLPVTCYPANAQLKWLSTDTRENYLKNGGHPVYREDDIDYSFNACGYRCPNFEPTSALKLVAIGCSHVMGVGLPSESLFHEIFAERLRSVFSRNVIVWNIAVPGAANDYIARMLHLAVPYLDPHIVLVNFTHTDRREYLSIQGVWMPYCPGYTPPDMVGREIKRHFDSLTSQYDDDLNLFRNYKSIESLLADRCWLFSTTSHPQTTGDPFDRDFARMKDHVDLARYAGSLDRIDFARDWSHFGPMSHKTLADCYWSCFCARQRLHNSLESKLFTQPT